MEEPWTALTVAGGQSMTDWSASSALGAYHAGVTVICELAADFTDDTWQAPTPCPEWRAADLAGHLRCVADDYHENLDDAPSGRMARLVAGVVRLDSLARKVARQNAAELAALPAGSGHDHITAFAASARGYARRAAPAWDLPHHRYGDAVVTVGDVVGAACVEWHVHAWDLARALGKDYRPAAPEVLVAAWEAGLPHLPLQRAGAPAGPAPAPGGPAAGAGPVAGTGRAAASQGAVRGGPGGGVLVQAGPPGGPGVAAWHALLRSAGRTP